MAWGYGCGGCRGVRTQVVTAARTWDPRMGAQAIVNAGAIIKDKAFHGQAYVDQRYAAGGYGPRIRDAAPYQRRT